KEYQPVLISYFQEDPTTGEIYRRIDYDLNNESESLSAILSILSSKKDFQIIRVRANVGKTNIRPFKWLKSEEERKKLHKYVEINNMMSCTYNLFTLMFSLEDEVLV